MWCDKLVQQGKLLSPSGPMKGYHIEIFFFALNNPW